MTFSTSINLALSFSKRPKLGFKVYPVSLFVGTDDSANFTRCQPEDAQAWAVYCLIQDGDLVVEEWIADLDTQEAAEQFRSLVCSLCGMDNCRLLTKDILGQMNTNDIIGTGVFANKKLHVGLLKWVAVRGDEDYSWSIYYHFSNFDAGYIIAFGDVISEESIVRGLIPCDREAWGLYRG